MKRTVPVAAALLCAVLFASSAEAASLQKMQTSVGCSDPVMRPCTGGRETLIKAPSEFRQRNNFSGLDKRARRPRGQIKPSLGLARVMAEGAGRVVNWIKPRAWCGWWMRRHLGVANPAGNLARWWAGYGRPAHGPHVGAIVVWRHHVGRITGRTADGRWIVRSGNDGHRVRERPRSVAGAIAFRWPA